jgi:hypothetical protein
MRKLCNARQLEKSGHVSGLMHETKGTLGGTLKSLSPTGFAGCGCHQACAPLILHSVFGQKTPKKNISFVVFSSI